MHQEGGTPYTYSTSDLPSGIVPESKSKRGSHHRQAPTATGESDITVTVRDAVGGEASTTFNLSVSAAPTALEYRGNSGCDSHSECGNYPHKGKSVRW